MIVVIFTITGIAITTIHHDDDFSGSVCVFPATQVEPDFHFEQGQTAHARPQGRCLYRRHHPVFIVIVFIASSSLPTSSSS